MVHLQDLRDLGEQLRRRDSAGPVVRSDERESDQAELDRVGIDSRGVPLDDSLLLELPDPLEDGGRGEADLPRAVKADLTLASGETIERWLALR